MPAARRRRAPRWCGAGLTAALLALPLGGRPAAANSFILDGYLTSSDPGENAKGERWLLCRDPTSSSENYPCESGTTVLIFTRPFYQEFQIPFESPLATGSGWYVFSLGAWDDPNEAQESFIGDESGNFGVSEVAGPPPPQPAPKMSDDEKKRFAHWSNYIGILGSASVFAGAIFAGTGNAAGVVVSAVIAAELGALAFVLNDIALDPIDNDYMEIAQPTPYPLPDLSPGGACAQRIGNGLSNTIGLAQAVSTAYNRMQGAIAAGDDYWTQQQGQAMLGYAAQLDNRLATVDPAKIFGCLPQRQPRDAGAVMSWERRLMRNGMPQYLAAAFAGIGITDPNDLASINGFFAVQDPALVSDGYNAIFGPRQSRPVYWQSLANNVP